jgi:hypothetical protein
VGPEGTHDRGGDEGQSPPSFIDQIGSVYDLSGLRRTMAEWENLRFPSH